MKKKKKKKNNMTFARTHSRDILDNASFSIILPNYYNCQCNVDFLVTNLRRKENMISKFHSLKIFGFLSILLYTDYILLLD